MGGKSSWPASRGGAEATACAPLSDDGRGVGRAATTLPLPLQNPSDPSAGTSGASAGAVGRPALAVAPASSPLRPSLSRGAVLVPLRPIARSLRLNASLGVVHLAPSLAYSLHKVCSDADNSNVSHRQQQQD